MARILFVGKRSPQQRDLVSRPYGRFHHLPAALADLGHHVRVLLCSHSGSEDVREQDAGVVRSTHDIRRAGPLGWYRSLVEEALAFGPDLVFGMSDAWYGWLAARLGRACGVPHAVDAYDDYESYMPWNVPLHLAWRRSIRDALLVTAAGPQLAAHLDRHRRAGATRTAIVPMSADPAFQPGERVAARARLGLPQERPLVGYTGGWSVQRGTELLTDVFSRVGTVVPDARFVVSGKPPADVAGRANVIATGYLPDDAMPDLLRAIDVACVVTADTAFGRGSYPSKLYEAMACDVPIVATRTEPVEWILGGDPSHLAAVGDADEIAGRIVTWLRRTGETPIYPPRATWDQAGSTLDALVRAALA